MARLHALLASVLLLRALVRTASGLTRLEEFLDADYPKPDVDGDLVKLDLLLDREGDQLGIYRKAFHNLLVAYPAVEKVVLNGGFFYRFEKFGERYLEEEFARSIQALRAVVDAAKESDVRIIDFSVRLQYLMYYTVDHYTYNHKALLKKYFNVSVLTEDYADFRTVFVHDGVPVRVHAELQFDPRRNRQQPGGRLAQNPRPLERFVGHSSTDGGGNVFWLEDMAYVLARRAEMRRLPVDHLFFSPLQEFQEPPNSFYAKAVKKMEELFDDRHPLRLFGSAVVQPKENSTAEFVEEWNNLKANIDAVVEAFRAHKYPLISVKVMAYFGFDKKATQDWAALLTRTYGFTPSAKDVENGYADFNYKVAEQPVQVFVSVVIPHFVEHTLDSSKRRQSPLYHIE